MIKSRGLFSLGLFGMSATQTLVLKSLCRLSQTRPATYRIVETPLVGNIDIAIVDSENSKAKNEWEFAWSNLPTVFVSSQPLSQIEPKRYNLIKAQLAGGLLQVLDRIAVDELGHHSGVVVSDELTSAQSREPGRTSRTKIGRALVIDDSVSVRTQMSLCLEQLDMGVDVAVDARQGLEKLQLGGYDIIFLDVVLPDMDGFQVCKHIRKSFDTRKTPVIMLTSKGSAINKIQGTLAGCSRYLTKPATQEEVSKVVREFIPSVGGLTLSAQT